MVLKKATTKNTMVAQRTLGNMVLPLCTLWLKITSNKVQIIHFMEEPEL